MENSSDSVLPCALWARGCALLAAHRRFAWPRHAKAGLDGALAEAEKARNACVRSGRMVSEVGAAHPRALVAASRGLDTLSNAGHA